MKNWKTSLFGLIAGASNLFAHGTNWKNVLVSTAFAALGLFSKDFNTGSSQQ